MARRLSRPNRLRRSAAAAAESDYGYDDDLRLSDLAEALASGSGRRRRHRDSLDDAHPMDVLDHRLDLLEERFEEILEQQDSDLDSGADYDELAEAVMRLAERVGAGERGRRDTAKDLKTRLADLERRIVTAQQGDAASTSQAARRDRLAAKETQAARAPMQGGPMPGGSKPAAPPPGAGIEDTLKAISARIDQISANATGATGAASAAGQAARPEDADKGAEEPDLVEMFDRGIGRLEDRLVKVLDRIVDAQQGPEAAGAEAKADAKVDRTRFDQLSQNVRAIADHLDAADADRGQSHLQLRSTVEDIARRLDDVPETTARFFAEPLERMAATIDLAGPRDITRIEDELDRISRAVEHSIKVEFAAMRIDLEALGKRLDEAANPAAQRFESELLSVAARLEQAHGADITSLRDDITSLGERIERSVSVGTTPRLEAIETRLGQLAGWIENASAPEDSPKLAAIEQSIAELTNRVAASRGIDPSHLSGLSRQIDTLGQEIGALKGAGLAGADMSDAGFSQAIGSLEARIGELTARIEAQPPGQADSAMMADMRSHIAELSGRIEASAAPAVDPAALEGIRSEISSISARLDAGGVPSAGDLGQIETRIAMLAEQLGAAGSEIGRLPSLESGVSSLNERIEQLRADISDTARKAAEQAVAKALADMPPRVAEDGADAALRTDLAALLEAGQASSQRTEASLEAVRDTLGKIVDRLADLEDEVDVIGTEPSPPAPAAKPPSRKRAARSARPAQPPKPTEPAAHVPDAGEERAFSSSIDLVSPQSEMVLPPVAEESEPAAVDNTPLRPGTNEPYLGRFADTGRTSEPKLGETPEDNRESFLAAARAAARAARSETGELDLEPETDAPSGLKAALAKHRRKLLIGTAILLLTIGSVRLADMVLSGSDNPDLSGVSETIAVPEAAPADLEAPSDPDGMADIDTLIAPPPPDADTPTPGPSGNLDVNGVTTDTISQPPRIVGAPLGETPVNRDAATAADTESPANELTTNSIPDSAVPTPEVARAPLGLSPNQSLPDLPDTIGPQALIDAARNGDPLAQFEVATRYMEGRGVGQDFSGALTWYRAAAAQNFAPGQFRLATLYEKGRGVEADPRMAELWYIRAADRGNRNAMHNLAVVYAQGALGEPDYDKAARWFQAAADRGLRDSQYNIAILNARGLGVPPNLIEAYKWLAIAAASGDSEAAGKRDDVAGELDAPALAEAKAAAEAWRPIPIDDAANVVSRSPESWGGETQATTLDAPQMVAAAQLLLGRLGFDPGPPDGLMGPRTRNAIRSFQEQNSLPVTGLVTPELLEQLSVGAS